MGILYPALQFTVLQSEQINGTFVPLADKFTLLQCIVVQMHNVEEEGSLVAWGPCGQTYFCGSVTHKSLWRNSRTWRCAPFLLLWQACRCLHGDRETRSHRCFLGLQGSQWSKGCNHQGLRGTITSGLKGVTTSGQRSVITSGIRCNYEWTKGSNHQWTQESNHLWTKGCNHRWTEGVITSGLMGVITSGLRGVITNGLRSVITSGLRSVIISGVRSNY